MFIVYKYETERFVGLNQTPAEREVQYFCKDGEWHLPEKAAEVGFEVFFDHEEMQAFCRGICFEAVLIKGKLIEVSTGWACPAISLPVR